MLSVQRLVGPWDSDTNRDMMSASGRLIYRICSPSLSNFRCRSRSWSSWSTMLRPALGTNRRISEPFAWSGLRLAVFDQRLVLANYFPLKFVSVIVHVAIQLNWCIASWQICLLAKSHFIPRGPCSWTWWYITAGFFGASCETWNKVVYQRPDHRCGSTATMMSKDFWARNTSS